VINERYFPVFSSNSRGEILMNLGPRPVLSSNPLGEIFVHTEFPETNEKKSASFDPATPIANAVVKRHQDSLREIFDPLKSGPVATARIVIPNVGSISCFNDAFADEILFKNRPDNDFSTFQFIMKSDGNVVLSLQGRFVSSVPSESRCFLVSTLSTATSFNLDWKTPVGDVIIRPVSNPTASVAEENGVWVVKSDSSFSFSLCDALPLIPIEIGSVVGNSLHLNQISTNVDGKLYPGAGESIQIPLSLPGKSADYVALLRDERRLLAVSVNAYAAELHVLVMMKDDLSNDPKSLKVKINWDQPPGLTAAPTHSDDLDSSPEDTRPATNSAMTTRSNISCLTLSGRCFVALALMTFDRKWIYFGWFDLDHPEQSSSFNLVTEVDAHSPTLHLYRGHLYLACVESKSGRVLLMKSKEPTLPLGKQVSSISGNDASTPVGENHWSYLSSIGGSHFRTDCAVAMTTYSGRLFVAVTRRNDSRIIGGFMTSNDQWSKFYPIGGRDFCSSVPPCVTVCCGRLVCAISLEGGQKLKFALSEFTHEFHQHHSAIPPEESLASPQFEVSPTTIPALGSPFLSVLSKYSVIDGCYDSSTCFGDDVMLNADGEETKTEETKTYRLQGGSSGWSLSFFILKKDQIERNSLILRVGSHLLLSKSTSGYKVTLGYRVYEVTSPLATPSSSTGQDSLEIDFNLSSKVLLLTVNSTNTIQLCLTDEELRNFSDNNAVCFFFLPLNALISQLRITPKESYPHPESYSHGSHPKSSVRGQKLHYGALGVTSTGRIEFYKTHDQRPISLQISSSVLSTNSTADSVETTGMKIESFLHQVYDTVCQETGRAPVHCAIALPSELITTENVKTFRRQASLLGLKIYQLVSHAKAIAAHVFSDRVFHSDVFVCVVERSQDRKLYSCSMFQSKSESGGIMIVSNSCSPQLKGSLRSALEKIHRLTFLNQLASPLAADDHWQGGGIAAAVFGGERNKVIWFDDPEEYAVYGVSSIAESFRRMVCQPNRVVAHPAKILSAESVSLTTNSSSVLVCSLALGSPPKSVSNVVIDTGSSDLWVTSSSLRSSSSISLSPYASSPLFRVTYGSGYVSGWVYEANVTLGNYLAPLQPIGMVTTISDSLSASGINGILGLAYSSLSSNQGDIFSSHHNFNFLSTLVEQGVVHEDCFSLHLDRNGAAQLVLGGYLHQQKHYVGPITWVPLVERNYYSFRFDSISIGNQQICSEGTAIADTGTSAILGPNDYITALHNIDLNSNPNLTIGVDGVDFLLPLADLINSNEIGVLPPNVLSAGWVFGVPWFSKVFTVFDRSNGRLGFARTRETPLDVSNGLDFSPSFHGLVPFHSNDFVPSSSTSPLELFFPEGASRYDRSTTYFSYSAPQAAKKRKVNQQDPPNKYQTLLQNYWNARQDRNGKPKPAFSLNPPPTGSLYEIENSFIIDGAMYETDNIEAAQLSMIPAVAPQPNPNNVAKLKKVPNAQKSSQMSIWIENLQKCPRKKKSQRSVMRMGANSLFEAPFNSDMEWLHRIAATIGPPTGFTTTQVPDNLVIGTAESNTWMLMLETTIKTFLPTVSTQVTNQTLRANIVTTVIPVNGYAWWTQNMTYQFMFYHANSPQQPFFSREVIFPMFARRKPLLAMQECEQVLLADRLGLKVDPKSVPNSLLLATTQPPTPFNLDDIITTASTSTVCTVFGITFSNFHIQLYNPITHAFVDTSPGFATSDIISLTGSVDSLFGIPLSVSAEGILGVTTDQVSFYNVVFTVNSFSAKQLFPFFDFEFQTISFTYGNMDSASMKLITEDLSTGTSLEGFQPENRIHFRVSATLELGQMPSFEKTLSIVYPNAVGLLKLNGEFFPADDSTSFPDDASSFSGFCVSGLLDLSQSQSQVGSSGPLLQLQQIGVRLRSVSVIDISRGPSVSSMKYAVDLFGNLLVQFREINLTIDVSASFDSSSGALTVGGYLESWENAFGIQGLTLTSLRVSFQIDPSNPSWNATAIDMGAVLTLGDGDLEIGGHLGPDLCGAVIELEDEVTLEFLISLMTSLVPSTDSLPDADGSALSTFSMKNATLSISNAAGSIGSFLVSSGFVISGEVSIYGHTAAAAQLQISSEGFQLAGSITQFSPDFAGIDITDASLNLSYRTSEHPNGKGISFFIDAKVSVPPIQSVEGLLVYDTQAVSGTPEWIFYAKLTSALNLGNSFPALHAIPMLANGVTLDSSLMLASADAVDVPSTLSIAPFASVSKGANLAVTLASVSALSTLCNQQSSPGIVMVIGLNQHSFEADFQFNGTVNLGHGITTDPIQAGVKMAEEQCLFFVDFGLTVAVPNQVPLDFSLELDVGELGANAIAQMNGMWSDAFGVSGLSIGDVQLQVEIIYETFLELGPSLLGLQGVISYGTSFTVTLKGVYGINPEDLTLVGSYEGNLTLENIAGLILGVCGFELPTKQIPNIEFDEAMFSMSSLGGTVGTVTYPAGLSFSAKLLLFKGCVISIQMLFGKNGFHGRESIGDLSMSPSVSLSDCTVDLQLLQTSVGITIYGNLQLFGMHVVAQVALSAQGFSLSCQIHLGAVDNTDFNLSISGEFQLSSTDFELTLAISDEAFFIWINGAIKGELAEGFDDLKSAVQTALQTCQAAQETFKNAMSDAETTVARAQSEADGKLQDAQEKLKSARNDWTNTKAKATSSLKSQKNAIKKAQSQLDHAKQALVSTQNIANQTIQHAKSAVTKAQQTLTDTTNKEGAAVNSAQKKVDSLNEQIKTLNGKIDHEVHEAHRVHRNPILRARYEAEKAAFETEKAGVEAAVGTANGVLSAAKATCDRMIKAAQETLDGAKATLQEEITTQDGLVSAAKVAVNQCQVALTDAVNAARTAEQGAITSMSAVTDTLNAAVQAVTIAQTGVDQTMETGAQTLQAVENGTDAVAFKGAKQALVGSQKALEDAINAANSLLKSLSINSISGRTQYSSHVVALQLSVSGSLSGVPFNLPLSLDLSQPTNLATTFFNTIVAQIRSLLPNPVV
jgi:hypothetical protein